MFHAMGACNPSVASHSGCYRVGRVGCVQCVFHEPCSCKQRIFAVDELGQVFAECFGVFFGVLVHSELNLAFFISEARWSLSVYLTAFPPL